MSALDKRLTLDLRKAGTAANAESNLRRRLALCPALAVYWLRLDGTLRQRLARDFSERHITRQVHTMSTVGYEGHFNQEDTMAAATKTTTQARDVRIWRDNTGVVHATVDGQPLRHVVHHSPSGFEVGYGGSGPADLALSILNDHLERTGYEGKHVGVYSGMCLHAAYALHQDFKWEVIANFDRREREWIIRAETVAAFVEAHRSTLDIYARHNVDDGMMG